MPRAGLSRQQVIGEAAALADVVGFDKLTLAAVAKRAGVRLPSLYKHIESLDALRQGVAALATRELAEAVTSAAVGRAGADALQSVADAYRGFAQSHPGRYAATIRAADPDDAEHNKAAEAVLRVVFAVLAGYDITGDDAVDAARALRAALHGFLTLEAAGGFGMPRDVGRSYEQLVVAFDVAFRHWPASPVGPTTRRRKAS